MKRNPQAEEFIREITRHQPTIGAYLRVLLPSQVDSQDVLQEVNITLWNKRRQYRAGTNFKAWALKIAKYHALNESRRARKRADAFVFDDDILEDLAGSGLITPSLLDERMAALRVCIQKLRPQDRELLDARYYDDASIEKFARLHKRNPGTIRAVLRNIRKQLRKCIGLQLADVME